MKRKIKILGSGLSGLAIAHHLGEDFDITIHEPQKEIGGLCRSFQWDGITFDAGPHILFSRNEQTLKELTSLVPCNKIERVNKIYFRQPLGFAKIDYPFENGIYKLQNVKEYTDDFFQNKYGEYESQNMQQFFLKTFGDKISNEYLLPYNKKIWQYDPAFMSTDLVERIPRPSDEDMKLVGEGKKTVGFKEQQYFYYPKEGGIQSLINKLAEGKKITTSVNIWQIFNPRYKDDMIVNTLPLPILFKSLDVPDDLKSPLESLKTNKLYLHIIKTKKTFIDPFLAIYFADDDVPFHRLTNVGFFGKNYQSEEYDYFMFESTRNFTEQETWESFRDIFLSSSPRAEDYFVSLKRIEVDYSYPIHTLNRKESVSQIFDYLANQGIYTVGRWGLHSYLNLDKCWEYSKEIANFVKEL
jgi:protoporphyrinogen oxidase